MSLRAKILAIVAVVVVAYGIVDLAVQHRVIYPSFVALERDEAEKDLRRCIEAIDREIQQLGATAGDYGAWNDTYQFAVDRNKRYVESNLSPSSFKNLGVNLMAICNVRGEVLTSQVLDLTTQEPMEVPELPKDRYAPGHILVHHEGPQSAASGILITGNGPLLVASRPILTDNREGPVRGAVIVGKFLDEKLVQKLRDQTKVQFEVLPALSITEAPAGETQPSAQPVAVRVDERDRNTLTASATLCDIGGRPVLPIRAAIPRDITARGRTAMQFANYSIVIIGLAVLVVLLALLQWAVLDPVSRLTRHAVRIGSSGDLTARLAMKTGDEIGTLATEFDRMVEHLAQARKELLKQSYRSGLAEMASGTLHNVRNALTPVLVEIDLLRKELSSVPVDQIETAKRQLSDVSVPDSRKQDLAKFLDLANGRLVAVTRETHTKLDHVVGRAKQIEQFLSDQEGAARTDRPMECVAVDALVRDAESLLPAELRERLSIEMGPGVAGLGSMRTHRICMLQVFGNLLTNAAEAIGEAGKTSGTVRIDASTEDGDGGPAIHLRFRDDGVGIPAENLARIFERGFTTKAKTSRGLGLHWCANSVAAMGGRMYAESDGPGQGACLHVVVPNRS